MQDLPPPSSAPADDTTPARRDATRALLDALIALLDGATHARSPHTGHHSERVPAIALALLDAVLAEDDGPFAGFEMDAAARDTFRLAARLHDCGKLLCSEPVLDKATKLEAVHNRIHEIRTRFEVLSRDAELAYWRGLHAGGDPQALQATLADMQRKLADEFAFVARSNTGESPLHAADLARLREIGARTWEPRFDREAGLSYGERMRQQQTGIPLPPRERLLADRPEHIDAWGDARPAVTPDAPGNPWGFDMAVPAHAAHRGELHNLGIARGTLNDAERFHANLHAAHTLTMLAALPLPPDMAALPGLAANHHERLDGSGYPRRLDATALGIPDRIIAIADVFEALTAHDRPYKSPRSVVDTLSTMRTMVDAGHLDGALFALFLRSGVCQRYAAEYLGETAPLDIDAYLDRSS